MICFKQLSRAWGLCLYASFRQPGLFRVTTTGRRDLRSEGNKMVPFHVQKFKVVGESLHGQSVNVERTLNFELTSL